MNFAAEAWLIVARGGWWTASEILAQIDTEFDVEDVYSGLYTMAQRYGTLVRRKVEGRTFEYAVTPDCIPPRGLTVKQILSALTTEQG